MPYTLPSSDDFLTRYPEFEGTDDDQITALIAEAGGYVDDSWREADYQPAIMLLTAHLLATGQNGAASSSASNLASASVSIGGITETFGKPSGATVVGGTLINSTGYGERFAVLRDANFPPILVI